MIKKKIFPIILILLLSSFLFLFVACSSNGTYSSLFGKPYQGWLCFESGEDIWVMRTDGSELQNITFTDSLWEVGCKLSWDSSQIIYTDLDGNLYLINRNGTGKKTLLDNGGVMYPSWSPDGTKIVYVQTTIQNETPVSSIYLLDIESNEKVRIYEGGLAAIISPVMSPDGTKIAYSSDGIYTMNVDGSNIEQIKEPFERIMIGYLAWSRDGNKIAFTTMNGVSFGATSWSEYGDIYYVDTHYGSVINITNNAPDEEIELEPGKNIFKFDQFPCWTNGDQIVFLSNGDSRSYTQKPYIMEKDGSSVSLLVDQEMQGMDYQPDIKTNSTAVPTTFDLSTAASSIMIKETATAQAIYANCGNIYEIPTPVNWHRDYCERFDQDNGKWWTGTSESEFAIKTYKMENGEFLLEINSKTSLRSMNYLNVDYSDFLVTVTLDIDGETDCIQSGFNFRYNEKGDDRSYYTVQIEPANQYYYARFSTLGYNDTLRENIPLSSGTSSAINENGPNQLSVLAEGSVFKIYINGEEVGLFSDHHSSSGDIVLTADVDEANTTCTFHYDNFLIYTP